MPSGATASWHRVMSTRVDLDGDQLVVELCSWPNRLAWESRYAGETQVVSVPLSALSPGVFLDSVRSFLLSGPLAGTVVATESLDLEEVKKRKWAEIKVARSADINSGLETPYGVFQATAAERQNITDAVLLAQTLTSKGLPVQIEFTLADDSVAVLGLNEMETVGLLLGQKIQAAHAKARTIRAAIAAAETVEEVTSIQW